MEKKGGVQSEINDDRSTNFDPNEDEDELSMISDDHKTLCEKVLNAVEEIVAQEKIEKNNNLLSRITDGLNKLK